MLVPDPETTVSAPAVSATAAEPSMGVPVAGSVWSNVNVSWYGSSTSTALAGTVGLGDGLDAHAEALAALS